MDDPSVVDIDRLEDIVQNYLTDMAAPPEAVDSDPDPDPYLDEAAQAYFREPRNRVHVRVMLGGWHHTEPYMGYEDVLFVVMPQEAKQRGGNHVGINWDNEGELARVLENHLADAERKNPTAASITMTLATNRGSGSWLHVGAARNAIVDFLEKHSNVTFVTEHGHGNDSLVDFLEYNLRPAHWTLTRADYLEYTGSVVQKDPVWVFTTLESRMLPLELGPDQTEAWMQEQRSRHRSAADWDWNERSRQEKVPVHLMVQPDTEEQRRLRELYIAFGDPSQV